MTRKILRFTAETRANSYDPESRSFQVVCATDAPVDRGNHLEILALDQVFSTGLPDTLPLQVDHSTSVRDTIGTLSSFRLETLDTGIRALVATAKLSSRPDIAAIESNIADGTQKAFSVGFTVSAWANGTDRATGKKTRTAIKGKIFEGSLVVSPADPHSKIRSSDMKNKKAVETTEDDDNQQDESTVRLRSLAIAAGADEKQVDLILATDASDADKTALILSGLNGKPKVRAAGDHNETSLDNPEVLRRSAVEAFDAIYRNEQPQGVASAVLADGEVAFARRLLRTSGVNVTGMGDDVVLRNAAATSDFAFIAGNMTGLQMRREYEAAVSPIAALFGASTVGSFNKETVANVDWTTLAVGDKLENGKYRYSYVDESGETIFVSTLGGVTAVSRELSINAMGRLGDMGVKFGQRLAAETADRQVAFLEQNSGAGPIMADGNAVFHASRGNIEDFPSVLAEQVNQMMLLRTAMTKRQGKGKVMIGKYPTHWIVPGDLESEAEKLVAQVTPTAMADVNPMAGKLKIVVEPRLSGSKVSWLAIEPAKMDGAVRVGLRGFEAPFVEARQNFDTDNLEFKIRHDFGLGWLEWRSWTRLDHA